MENNKAVPVLALGGLLALGLILAKKAPAEPKSIDIKIYDSEGNLVVAHSPLSLIEGDSYTAVVTVVNMSTKAGEPWKANLDVGFQIFRVEEGYPATQLMAKVQRTEFFLAGQTVEFPYPFTIPVGYGGDTGYVAVEVSGGGALLDSARLDFNIALAPIIYEADVEVR